MPGTWKCYVIRSDVDGDDGDDDDDGDDNNGSDNGGNSLPTSIPNILQSTAKSHLAQNVSSAMADKSWLITFLFRVLHTRRSSSV